MQTSIESETLYRHYKGNIYYVHTVAKHSETEEPMVVYQEAELGADEIFLKFDKVWCRPLDNFCSSVEVDGKTVPRFAEFEEE